MLSSIEIDMAACLIGRAASCREEDMVSYMEVGGAR